MNISVSINFMQLKMQLHNAMLMKSWSCYGYWKTKRSQAALKNFLNK